MLPATLMLQVTYKYGDQNNVIAVAPRILPITTDCQEAVISNDREHVSGSNGRPHRLEEGEVRGDAGTREA